MVRLPFGPALSCPETKALFQGVMDEACSIVQAMGVGVSENFVHNMMVNFEGIPPDTKSSQLESRHERRAQAIGVAPLPSARHGRKFEASLPNQLIELGKKLRDVFGKRCDIGCCR